MFPVAHRLNYVSTPSDLPEPLKMEGRRCPQRSEPAVLTKFVPPPGPHHSKGVLHGLPASPIFRFESSGHAPALRCARGLPLRSNGDAGATCPRTRNARRPLEGLRAAHKARSEAGGPGASSIVDIQFSRLNRGDPEISET